jgi:predicted metal-dependent hydrolase
VTTKHLDSKRHEPHHIRIGALSVEVVRKDIKNLHLGVYPPNGRVRVAAPLVVDDEAVRLAVIEKLGWIKRQKARFTQQPRQSPREMVSGESHYFLGKRYRLRVHVVDAPAKAAPRIAIRGIASLDLFVTPNTTTAQRDAALQRWYRGHLKELLEPMLQKWQPVIGVQAADWGIKKMKTKWGSCNTSTRRVWLNLELAKKPVQCIEYIVVHELVHLLERNHTERFSALMDGFLPNWRACRETLNHGILGHEVWDY